MKRSRTGIRVAPKGRVRLELFACARQVDSVAAQVLMLAEDDWLTDDEASELEAIGQQLRRIADRLFDRVEQL